jgi:hypothetical protein
MGAGDDVRNYSIAECIGERAKGDALVDAVA